MDVSDRDKGTYTCIMNTTLDHDSASAVLTVVGMFTDQLTRIRRSGPHLITEISPTSLRSSIISLLKYVFKYLPLTSMLFLYFLHSQRPHPLQLLSTVKSVHIKNFYRFHLVFLQTRFDVDVYFLLIVIHSTTTISVSIGFALTRICYFSISHLSVHLIFLNTIFSEM